MKQFLRCCIFIFLFLSSPVLPQQSIEELYSSATKLFENKAFYSAITEYKRVLFFDSKDQFTFQSNYNIGICYKYGGFYDEAIKYFSYSQKYTTDVDQIYNCKEQVICCNILRRTTERALQLCTELDSDSRFNSYAEEIKYWKSWSFIFADDWQNAEKVLPKNGQYDELRDICSKVNQEKVSVTFAKVISYILPGFGQFYTGNYLSGLLSLVWNISAGYFTVNSFIENRAFDGLVIGELVWLRFYRGNVQNAEKFAEAKNLSISNNALEFLQKDYKGKKP